MFLKSAAMGWVFLKTPATGATVKIPPWTVLVWYLLIWLSQEGDPNLLSYSRITGLCVCMCLCVCVWDRERGEISPIHVCPLMDLFVFLSRLFPAPPPWSVCRDMGYDLEVSESTLLTNKESWYFLGVVVCVLPTEVEVVVEHSHSCLQATEHYFASLVSFCGVCVGLCGSVPSLCNHKPLLTSTYITEFVCLEGRLLVFVWLFD